MSNEIVKEYSNGEITVVWKPDKCTHASFCWKELPEVFNPQARPWVNIKGADSDRIIKQVERCPSGALTYYRNDGNMKKEEESNTKSDLIVEVIHNGPLLIKGSFSLKDKDGIRLMKGMTAFCRCGASKNEPYCDGSHEKVNFKG